MSKTTRNRDELKKEESLTLSLLQHNGKQTGRRSGLNWGQRPNRNPDEAYIPLPSKQARKGFFPVNGVRFRVETDDGKKFIMRVEQANNKAITTPDDNAEIGKYFRARIGVDYGKLVEKEDLERYGRTDVTFYKLDDEQFVMDFSV